MFYKIAGSSPEQVTEYYQQRLSDHTGGAADERCLRFPATGDFPRDPNTQNYVPYFFTCMFDRSNLNATQFTKVIIRPGMPHPDPALDSEGFTVVQYEQQWQP